MAAPETVVVGDTPRDVKSARAAGAIALAVATGKFSREELAAHAPRLVLGTLGELPPLLAADPLLALSVK